MKKIRCLKAFTLAEILVTLAIIGIVAAITIPAITTDYKAKALATQKKKAISSLAKGTRLLMAGDNVATIRDTKLASCDVDDKACIAGEIKKVFNVVADDITPNDIFDKSYQFTSEPKKVWDDAGLKYVFMTSDGVILGIQPSGAQKVESDFSIIADVNGAKNPNKGAEDLCKYSISNQGKIIDECASMADWNRTRVCSAEDTGACNSETCVMAGGTWVPRRCWKIMPEGRWECSYEHCAFSQP